MQEGFFQIAFPHLANTASFFQQLLERKPKTGGMRDNYTHCSWENLCWFWCIYFLAGNEGRQNLF